MLFLLRSCVLGVSCESYYTTCTKNATAICEYRRKNAAERPEGRDITRRLLSPSRLRRQPPPRGALQRVGAVRVDRVVRPYFPSFRASPQTGVGIRPSEKGIGLPRRCAPRSKCPWGTPRNDSAAALLGRTESSAPTRFVRDVEDAVPYGMVGGVCQGRLPYDASCPGASRGRDAYSVIRPLFPAAPFSPLRRTGRSRTPSSTDPCGTRRRQRG